MLKQIENKPESVESLKQLQLGAGEGVMFVKFVLLKQETLASGAAQAKINAAPAAILMGDLGEMKSTLSGWLNEALEAYAKTT